MRKIPLIKKASGETEPFSKEKLEGSLRRAGANEELISVIIDEILSWLKDGTSTKMIYTKAFNLLKRKKSSMAARYSLKKAIMELGPTGYPFEHFVGQLIKQQGFDIQVGQIIHGQCIDHEVDVVATSGNKQYLVECKFYNSQGKNANVKVPLYIHSRVNDIIKKRQSIPEFNNLSFHGMIVTNTRFTSDAIDYGKCAGLHLVSWDYPKDHSLKDMVEKNGIFPITALTSLKSLQKNKLLEEGVVLCRQLCSQPDLLEGMGLSKNDISKVLIEAKDLINYQD
jgi:hypothetical protein